ncbi:phenylalanine--tRNA ligase subunit beta [Candidatus Microgenomates bacterium]|nr:phenylalanine--tRNA ligase subunit beta [Candidatus Microgenomates bacterium]
MLIPLSWLKEYVDIKMPFSQLAARLLEVGLTVETWTEKDSDIIFDPEITPNRPDWMSVYGIAREISAITGAALKKDYPFKGSSFSKKIKNPLPITVKPNFPVVPRKTSVIIKNVRVKPSPEWLQKRIKQVGLRPINNLVDITNYVLWAYGSLLHVFDYDKIRGHQMTIELSKGGEDFRSLDGIDYKLPANAVIIKDVGRVIDLLPLKGGENTAASAQTKTVLLHSVTCDPVLTRRTSQALGLRSDSSTIAERGLDPNGTVIAVNHALALILELAGGEIASEIMDLKDHEFQPWTVSVSHDRIEKVLGIKIAKKTVVDTFTRLGLSVTGNYQVTIPTFRNDLHIEEDLIEEIGRIYGYNKFPKTLPASAVPTTAVAYAKNYDLEYAVKQTLKGAGYSEIYTYSLISENQLIKLAIDPTKVLRVDNPISRDYEYLRPFLLGNLLEAVKLNLPNFSEIKLFELGKVYKGETVDEAKEQIFLSCMLSGEKFLEAKGTCELLLKELGLTAEFSVPQSDKIPGSHPGRSASIKIGKEEIGFLGEVHPAVLNRFGIKTHVTGWFLNYQKLESLAKADKRYQSVPKYPAVTEDLSLIIPAKVLYGDVVEMIKKTSSLVSSVDLLDTHETSKTLRLTYLDRTKNLTDRDVAAIRSKLMKKLAELKVRMK